MLQGSGLDLGERTHLAGVTRGPTSGELRRACTAFQAGLFTTRPVTAVMYYSNIYRSCLVHSMLETPSFPQDRSATIVYTGTSASCRGLFTSGTACSDSYPDWVVMRSKCIAFVRPAARCFPQRRIFKYLFKIKSRRGHPSYCAASRFQMPNTYLCCTRTRAECPTWTQTNA